MRVLIFLALVGGSMFAAEHTYLAPFTGDGSKVNPFKSVASSELSHYSITDLRDDSTRSNGWCIVTSPHLLTNTALIYLCQSDITNRVTAAAMTQIQSRTGKTPTSAEWKDVIAAFSTNKFTGLKIGTNNITTKTNPPKSKLQTHLRSAPTVFGAMVMQTPARGVVVSGGGSAATATDTFNRADASPISNPMSDGVSTWTSGPGDFGDIAIAGNLCTSSGGGEKAGRVATPTFAADQWSQITMVTGNINDVSAGVRMNASGDCYFGYVFDNNNLKVYEIVGTTGGSPGFSELANFVTTATIVAGDAIRIQAIGTNLEVLLNGVPQGDVDDGTYSTGQPAVHISGDDDFDTFSASDS